MAHSFVCNWQHIVFSTKERLNLIRTEIEQELWAYMAGVAKHKGYTPLKIGGIGNHVHLLVGIPGRVDISEAVQTIKANSSRWMRTRFACSPGRRDLDRSRSARRI
jgi:putative transposase